MIKLDSYSNKGTKLTPVSLPREWETKENMALLAQAIHVYTDRQHIGLAKTKTRSEINRTTKKWYKQKGTGGARHGARSAPIFVGGGIAHGPKAERRELKLTQKLKRSALSVAVTHKAKEKKIVVADLSGFKKTKDAQSLINKIYKKRDARVTFVLADDNLKARRFMRNLKNATVVKKSNLNAYDVFLGGTIVLDKGIFKK